MSAYCGSYAVRSGRDLFSVWWAEVYRQDTGGFWCLLWGEHVELAQDGRGFYRLV